MTEIDMYYGAMPYLFKKAKELRLNPTKAEAKLWEYLKRGQLGVRFKAQHPISEFIADFYCHRHKLVIEVDGEIHNNDEQKKYDLMRTKILNEYGIREIRFTNMEIKENIDSVIDRIKQEI
ncbi:MAG TPA: endonuclease domain-containing protein [Anditalea sp.]|nr:endonuclease domain-containing protein [Anditalea sp.]